MIHTDGAPTIVSTGGELCPECGRTITRDELRGKPSQHRGYCLGQSTCLQRPVPRAISLDRPAHKGYPGTVR